MHTENCVQNYLENCTNRGLSLATVKWYRIVLNEFAGIFPDLPEDPESIEEFIFSHDVGDERRHGRYRVIRAFFNYLEFKDTSDTFKNPLKHIKAPKRAKKEKPYLSLEQIKTLLEYPLLKPWVRVLLYFLCDTGCRIGEAANLRNENIFHDEDSGNCFVKISGKTGERIIPLSDDVREMIMRLGKEKPFPSKVDHLTRHVTEAFKAVGLKGSSHTLRHSFCTHWEGDIDTLRTITGHTSIAMIENYRHDKLGHAIRDHKKHAPLSQIYEDNLVSEKVAISGSSSPGLPAEVYIELGELRERVKWLEKQLLESDVTAYLKSK